MNEKALTHAIETSKKLACIINVEYRGDYSSLKMALDAIYDGEIDYCEFDENVIDAWGWQPETTDGMEWRLTVTLSR